MGYEWQCIVIVISKKANITHTIQVLCVHKHPLLLLSHAGHSDVVQSLRNVFFELLVKLVKIGITKHVHKCKGPSVLVTCNLQQISCVRT